MDWVEDGGQAGEQGELQMNGYHHLLFFFFNQRGSLGLLQKLDRPFTLGGPAVSHQVSLTQDLEVLQKGGRWMLGVGKDLGSFKSP